MDIGKVLLWSSMALTGASAIVNHYKDEKMMDKKIDQKLNERFSAVEEDDDEEEEES